MADNWDFYFTRLNNKLASILTDLNLYSKAPISKKPWALRVRVFFNQPREDGLSAQEEAETLWALEDTLCEAAESFRAQLVGKVTSDGWRDFYFYAPSSEGWKKVVQKGLKDFPAYSFECGGRHEPKWDAYFELLYPDEHDMQRIQNRKVVESLQRHGDPLTEKRPVFHWIYFDRKQGRAKFKAAVEKLGYEIKSEHTSEGEMPLCLQIQRVDHADWDSINNVTLELYDLAKEQGGSYDGWETSVEKK